MITLVLDEAAKQEIINDYFYQTPFLLLVQALSRDDVFHYCYSEPHGLYLSDYFDEEEEGYFGRNKVRISEMSNFYDDDEVELTYSEFWGILQREAAKYLKDHADEADEVNSYMVKIKEKLGV